MHVDQATRLVKQIEQQWPEPSWSAPKREAWTRAFTDPQRNFTSQEILSQLAVWARGSDQQPRITEIMDMVIRFRPSADDDDEIADLSTPEGRHTAQEARRLGESLQVFLDTRRQSYGNPGVSRRREANGTMDYLWEAERANGGSLDQQLHRLHQRVAEGNVPFWHQIPAKR